MNFPGRSQRGPDPYPAHGGRVDANNPRSGVEDDGNVAWPERVAEAARLWPQADAADFEPLDSKGRRWRDLASGTEFRALSGAPLLSVGEPTRGVACFIVWGNRIVVLRRADYQEELQLGPVQHVYAQKLTAASPGPALKTDVRIS